MNYHKVASNLTMNRMDEKKLGLLSPTFSLLAGLLANGVMMKTDRDILLESV